jgi:hypothetical protein
MKVLSWGVDWQFGHSCLRQWNAYAVQATTSLVNYLFQNTVMNRVPASPCSQDLNCHCFDPNTTFTESKAWVNPR